MLFQKYIAKDESEKKMNKKIDFCKITLLVATYNSKFDKLLLTLESILRQDFEDFQIVITDDGSIDNHFVLLEHYFEKRKFKKYKLVTQNKNVGTVKNLIHGLTFCKGKYVKFISAGDTLFCKNTLSDLFVFMESKKCTSCFGLMKSYRRDKEKLVDVSFTHPFDIESYRNNNFEKIKRNLILYSDNVSGAAICYEREFAVEYLKNISDYVVYEEDIFQVLAALEGKTVSFMDNYVVWYEWGEGVSTGGQSEFQKALAKDTDLFYERLYELYPDNKYIKKRHKLKKLYGIKNLYIRTVIRFFVNPCLVVYLVDSLIQKLLKKHSKQTNKIGFLQDEEFWKSSEKILKDIQGE